MHDESNSVWYIILDLVEYITNIGISLLLIDIKFNLMKKLKAYYNIYFE